MTHLNFANMMYEREAADNQWFIGGHSWTKPHFTWVAKLSHVTLSFGELRIHTSPTNCNEQPLKSMCGVEWPVTKCTAHSFLQRKLFILPIT
jgi:hypothetical protein